MKFEKDHDLTTFDFNPSARLRDAIDSLVSLWQLISLTKGKEIIPTVFDLRNSSACARSAR